MRIQVKASRRMGEVSCLVILGGDGPSATGAATLSVDSLGIGYNGTFRAFLVSGYRLAVGPASG